MSVLSTLEVVKRNGTTVPFDRSCIERAVSRAYSAAGVDPAAGRYDELIDALLAEIVTSFHDRPPRVEEIQDLIEQNLVHFDQYAISKHYILYREQHRQKRALDVQTRRWRAESGALEVAKRNGKRQPFDLNKVLRTITRHAVGRAAEIDATSIMDELPKNIFNGITTADLQRALILSAVVFIEHDSAYNYFAARLVLDIVYRESGEQKMSSDTFDSVYRETFNRSLAVGVEAGILTPELLSFDLERLSATLEPGRDYEFNYLGIQTLYERYFVRVDERVIETPQAFWMRVAMGLSLQEQDKTERAIEFYQALSTMRFVCSTPTLFRSGLSHPQLSSCYISTVKDDLKSIFKLFSDNAQLSKWSGGIGNDWTAVRATGSRIKSTNVKSQGVIPFLKIANDTTVAINRSGKRRGATCAYLETWHYDIEEFLDLRRNTGDDRRRTHDMNTANWIPDLFMKRVRERGEWTLFSPDEVPDLHDIYGHKFEERYVYYEQQALIGKIAIFKRLDAVKLWRKMLTRLFETGHPWITFKDPCNIRSPQDHYGVIHSSNLCTEVTLNNSADEIAVCNLGSLNLARHIVNGELDMTLLSSTIGSAIRMLDNVIDINFYPTPEARRASTFHRPIGMGMMGFQDVLFRKRLAFEDERTIEFADQLMEYISYHAIHQSSLLAKERGVYKSYRGSKWDRGIFPLDTIALLERERGSAVRVDRKSRLDWTALKGIVREHGVRNSNIMAIAPTATISNISGCFPSIEPIYKNLYVKANMNGEFTILNEYMISDLKRLGLWNAHVRDMIKYFDGSIEKIETIPAEIRKLYRVSFDIDPKRLIDLTAVRSKWIDQSQAHNVFVKGTSGKQINDIYFYAWEKGLKTTYYMRSLGASQIEKSTLSTKQYGYTQTRVYDSVLPPASAEEAQPELDINTESDEVVQVAACAITDPDCEACQ